MKKIVVLGIIGLIISSCSNDDTYVDIASDLDIELLDRLQEVSDGEGVAFFKLPESDDFSKIPQDPLNPITKEKVELGKLLLHETALGRDPKMEEMMQTYSCASCHQAAAGFGAGIRQGIGECGVGFGSMGEGRVVYEGVPVDSIDVQPLRSPTLLNVAYQDVMLWNGQFGATGTNAGTEASWDNIAVNFKGFQGIETQAIKGQDVHRLLIDDDFVNDYGYKTMFDQAFPNVVIEERYSTDNAALAIAAYERTLLANQSPWQQWLAGNSDALSEKEKNGALVFFGAGKCYECHTGPALNDKAFHAFGMGDFDNSSQALILEPEKFENVKKGRGGFTNNPADHYKFKTPTLYNLIDNGGFYGHGGTFRSVKEVIVYKNKGVAQSTEVPAAQLASQFGAINLSDEQIDDLTVFIESGLRDAALNRYVPSSLNSGNCFPNNDQQSQNDLGCN